MHSNIKVVKYEFPSILREFRNWRKIDVISNLTLFTAKTIIKQLLKLLIKLRSYIYLYFFCNEYLLRNKSKNLSCYVLKFHDNLNYKKKSLRYFQNYIYLAILIS